MIPIRDTIPSRNYPVVTTAIIKDCLLRDGKPDVLITPGEGLVEMAFVPT